MLWDKRSSQLTRLAAIYRYRPGFDCPGFPETLAADLIAAQAAGRVAGPVIARIS